jgi:glutamyl-tRNA reductase
VSVLPDLSFHVVGISHRTAPVEARERFALSPQQTSALLKEQHQSGRSALLLTTCNRCEYYWTGEEDGGAWLRRLAHSRGAASNIPFIRYDGVGAVRHLFLVAAGLDSQVLGETEILGQVRRAYDLARAAGTTTRDMDLILSGALSAGRRVRRETMLGRHPASVSSAAVDLVAGEWGSISAREIVVVGAGEAAEGILRALHERHATNVMLLNRHGERARVVAQAWGAQAGDIAELQPRLSRADLLIVATSSADPVVSHTMVAAARAEREDRELWVIDLGVPRNVEPTVRLIPGTTLFDLDDLQRLCCPAVGTPSAALAEAERVIDDELARLGLSLRGRVVAPQLAELHRRGVEMAEQELAWALAQLEGLSQDQREIVRQMADRLVRRVLYPVSRDLRREG